LGLYLGATGTPLYIQSPITFSTGKSDNLITNNLISDLSVNPTSLNLWTTNTGNPTITIGNQTTDGVFVNSNLAIENGLSVAESLAVNNTILCDKIQANDLYTTNLRMLDISQIVPTAGTLKGYGRVYIGTTRCLFPIYNE
jgi:hypothetical protein